MAARPTTLRGSVAAAMRQAISGPARSGGPVARPEPRPREPQPRPRSAPEASRHRPTAAPSAARAPAKAPRRDDGPSRPPGTWSDGAGGGAGRGSGGVAGSPEAALVAALGQHGRAALRMLYVDELEGARGSARPRGFREVYLTKLPWHDYSEQELLAWLQDFGPTEEVHFIRDAVSKELTGGGYARFKDPEDAAGLVESCEDGQGPRATWSLSEELLRPVGGRPRCAELLGGAAAARLLARLRGDVACASLALVGAARRGGRALEALGLAAGPLRFAWAVDAAGRGPAREALTGRLGAVVRGVFEGAAAKPAGVAKPTPSAEASNPSVPYIFVQGFPASWSEAQVRLVFTVFGGVSTVNVLPGEGSKNRMAYLKLKEPRRSAEVARQLNGTEVGDGDVIEKCTLRCQVLGAAASAAPAPALASKPAPPATSRRAAEPPAPPRRAAEAPRTAAEPPRRAAEPPATPRRAAEPPVPAPASSWRAAAPASRSAMEPPAPRRAAEPPAPRRAAEAPAVSRWAAEPGRAAAAAAWSDPLGVLRGAPAAPRGPAREAATSGRIGGELGVVSKARPAAPPIGSFALSHARRARAAVEEPPAKRRRMAPPEPVPPRDRSRSPLTNPFHCRDEEEDQRERRRRREERRLARGAGRRQRRHGHERPRRREVALKEHRSPSPCVLRLEPARRPVDSEREADRHRRRSRSRKVRKVTLLPVKRG